MKLYMLYEEGDLYQSPKDGGFNIYHPRLKDLDFVTLNVQLFTAHNFKEGWKKVVAHFSSKYGKDCKAVKFFPGEKVIVVSLPEKKFFKRFNVLEIRARETRDY